jgi:rod shape-determining protein MreC
MKTRLLIIAILLLILTVLLSRNDEHIADTLLGIINPIKQNYRNFTQNLEDKSQSYIFQKESIEKLSQENRILRKRLLEQLHYIKQVKNIYEVLPKLSRLPVSNISIVETISYVKLNSFSQIMLTKPEGLENNKLYGLMQGYVVAGIARIQNNQLYGYLTSDQKCRFSVFIGDNKAPGIALGRAENEMLVKFIPKWHKINVGDKVITSGLDGIFFADVPVGLVTKIEVQSSYTVAHIKTYSDVFHPKTFFLVNDAKATLVEGFDSNNTKIVPFAVHHQVDQNISSVKQEMISKDFNASSTVVSSIPSRIDQTQEEVIEPESPAEVRETPKKIKNKIPKQVQPKPEPSSFDLF